MKLRLNDVGHQFHPEGPWLFRGLHEVFSPGERCALTGPSGSGKSTLLAIIAGWTAPAEGEVTMDAVERVQWVFQNPHGVSRRSAIDHVVLPLIADGWRNADANERAAQICDRMGLGHLRDRRPFSTLSGGEAQRLMLARALVCVPDLLLVDEPTAQLDRSSAVAVNRAIGTIEASGGIVLIATHDPDTVAACDRYIDLTPIDASGVMGT
ncbi:ABC transporter ATP-binding protein [Leucobacter chromiiresistens]